MLTVAGHSPIAYALPAGRLLGLLYLLLQLAKWRRDSFPPSGTPVRWAASTGARWRAANLTLPSPVGVGAPLGPTLTLDLPETPQNLQTLEFFVTSLLLARNSTVAVCHASPSLRFRSGPAQMVHAIARAMHLLLGAGEEQRVAVRLAAPGACTPGPAAAAVADSIMLHVEPKMHVAAAAIAVEEDRGESSFSFATALGLAAAVCAIVGMIDERQRTGVRRARRASGRFR